MHHRMSDRQLLARQPVLTDSPGMSHSEEVRRKGQQYFMSDWVSVMSDRVPLMSDRVSLMSDRVALLLLTRLLKETLLS